MPRTALPTPNSSTDISGADGTKHLAAAGLQLAFELPPPAVGGLSPPRSSFSDSKNTSPVLEPCQHQPTSSPSSKPTTFFPVQAAETVKSRRRTSAAAQTAAKESDAFALPPPPTRSRKIIQMKPRATSGAMAEEGSSPAVGGPGNAKSASGASKSAATATSASAAANASAVPPPASGAGKKKQPSATSAAGRKIARKTAHSLIERRRRSKMNEEFALLKSMIPACSGEMHKLAILQASIEYVRYLEDCVSRLKSQRSLDHPVTPTEPTAYNPEQTYVYEHHHAGFSPTQRDDSDGEDDPNQDEEDPDIEMAGSELPSPAFTATHRSNQPSVSPTLLAQDARATTSSTSSSSSTPHTHHLHTSSGAPLLPDPRRQGSYSSTSASDRRHYSFSTSATTSPAFGPQQYPTTAMFGGGSGHHSAAGSALTSPALGPQRDIDQEATAALLMLNSDRRGSKDDGRRRDGRGMSVRDLLSA